jgi:hypothetical protein
LSVRALDLEPILGVEFLTDDTEWKCTFDETSFAVEADQRVLLQGMVWARNSGSFHGDVEYASSIREVGEAEVRGPAGLYETAGSSTNPLTHPSLFLTGPLAAGDYEGGFCFRSLESGNQYRVEPLQHVVMVIEAETTP